MYSKKLNFRFDWYEATLNPSVTLSELTSRLQFLGDLVLKPAKHGYAHFWDSELFGIASGGHNGEYGLHITIRGGEKCQEMVELIRGWYPDHRVTRADVCVDFNDSAAPFRLVQGVVYMVAHRKPFCVQTETQGDWKQAIKGRTLYCGSRASTHQICLYEKGKQMRETGKNPNAPLGWVRLEIRVRPEKDAKAKASRFSAEQFAISSRWTKAVCSAVGLNFGEGEKLSAPYLKPYSIRSIEHMLTQYAGTLRAAVDEGSITEEQLMLVIQSVIESGEFSGWWAAGDLSEQPYQSWMF